MGTGGPTLHPTSLGFLHHLRLQSILGDDDHKLRVCPRLGAQGRDGREAFCSSSSLSVASLPTSLSGSVHALH